MQLLTELSPQLVAALTPQAKQFSRALAYFLWGIAHEIYSSLAHK
jgi:hypothetical protein